MLTTKEEGEGEGERCVVLYNDADPHLIRILDPDFWSV